MYAGVNVLLVSLGLLFLLWVLSNEPNSGEKSNSNENQRGMSCGRAAKEEEDEEQELEIVAAGTSIRNPVTGVCDCMINCDMLNFRDLVSKTEWSHVQLCEPVATASQLSCSGPEMQRFSYVKNCSKTGEMKNNRCDADWNPKSQEWNPKSQEWNFRIFLFLLLVDV